MHGDKFGTKPCKGRWRRWGMLWVVWNWSPRDLPPKWFYLNTKFPLRTKKPSSGFWEKRPGTGLSQSFRRALQCSKVPHIPFQGRNWTSFFSLPSVCASCPRSQTRTRWASWCCAGGTSTSPSTRPAISACPSLSCRTSVPQTVHKTRPSTPQVLQIWTRQWTFTEQNNCQKISAPGNWERYEENIFSLLLTSCLSSGNFPCLKANLQFKRRVGIYLVNTYIPSVLSVSTHKCIDCTRQWDISILNVALVCDHINLAEGNCVSAHIGNETNRIFSFTRNTVFSAPRTQEVSLRNSIERSIFGVSEDLVCVSGHDVVGVVLDRRSGGARADHNRIAHSTDPGHPDHLLAVHAALRVLRESRWCVDGCLPSFRVRSFLGIRCCECVESGKWVTVLWSNRFGKWICCDFVVNQKQKQAMLLLIENNTKRKPEMLAC